MTTAYFLLVLGCTMIGPQSERRCMQFEDTEGPYKTRAACDKRAVEMGNFINMNTPFVPIKYVCKTLKPKGTAI